MDKCFIVLINELILTIFRQMKRVHKNEMNKNVVHWVLNIHMQISEAK